MSRHIPQRFFLSTMFHGSAQNETVQHGGSILRDIQQVRDYAKSDEKLDFLTSKTLRDRQMIHVRPDAKHTWLYQTDNDFNDLIPLATKDAKRAKKPSQEKAIFKTFSFGVVTNRDDWVYDETQSSLAAKVEYLIDAYNADRKRLAGLDDAKEIASSLDTRIKWTRAVKRDLKNRLEYSFEPQRIRHVLYRPYVRRHLYFSPKLNEMHNLMAEFFGDSIEIENPSIVLTDPTSQKPFMTLATDRCPDMHVVGAAAGGLVLPISDGNADNITDWALDQFRRQYTPGRGNKVRPITKRAIFHYVYAVLHDPLYREKYAQNLKRELPRIPFYPDFWRWSEWGNQLMEMHVGYESIEPWPIERTEILDVKARKNGVAPKAILTADMRGGSIVLDSETALSDIPPAAWEYKLGNRCALEWILDQYKEKTPKDSTIRAKFNTYRFAVHKEEVIDLLKRVTRVSVQTQRIVADMGAVRR